MTGNNPCEYPCVVGAVSRLHLGVLPWSTASHVASACTQVSGKRTNFDRRLTITDWFKRCGLPGDLIISAARIACHY